MEKVNIEFEKLPSGYSVAKFVTNDVVAVTINRDKVGDVIVEQSGDNDDKYVVASRFSQGKKVYFELNANIFPKYWKIRVLGNVESAYYTEGD